MAVVSGLNAKVQLISSTTAVSLSNPEATTAEGDNIRWHITNATKRMLDPRESFTVQVKRSGGYVTETTGFEILYGGGVVKFDSAQPDITGVQFTAGKYLPFTDWANAKGWKLDVQPDILDITALNTAWTDRYVSIKDASCSINGWWTDDIITSAIANIGGGYLGLVLYTDVANTKRWECLAYLNQEAINVPHDNLEDVSTDFKIVGEPNYATY